MTDPHAYLPDLETIASRPGPLLFPWPGPGNPGAVANFADASAWREFVLSLGIHSSLPKVVTAKFHRAQKLYLLGWLDIDLVKAGELAALVALEFALRDRYLDKIRRARQASGKKPAQIMLSHLLIHLVKNDGLTNEQLPIFRRSGGNPVARIVGDAKPSLSDIRNSLAHGDPFDGLPQAGLLELVRDLIDFAYRHWIEEHSRLSGPAA